MTDIRKKDMMLSHHIDNIRIGINNTRIAINNNGDAHWELDRLYESYQALFEFAEVHNLLFIEEYLGRDDDAPRRDMERYYLAEYDRRDLLSQEEIDKEDRSIRRFARYCRNRRLEGERKF